MCVIIDKPANFTITRNVISQMYKQNPDGLGILWHDTTTKVYKSLPNTPQECYDILAPYHHLRAIIHFRFATHGEPILANTHPFKVCDHVYLVHNGVLNTKALGLECDDGTDTEAYIRQYLRPLFTISPDPEKVLNAHILAMIGEQIGHSKFVLMDGEGHVYMVNPHLGEEIEMTCEKSKTPCMVWVSNTNWDWAEYTFKVDTPTKYSSLLDTYGVSCNYLSYDDTPDQAQVYLEEVKEFFCTSDIAEFVHDYTVLDFYRWAGHHTAYALLDRAEEGEYDPYSFAKIIVGTEDLPDDFKV